MAGTIVLPAGPLGKVGATMSVHDIAVRGLLHSLCRGTYPPDLDAEWDAETETFRPVMHVPEADGTWRTIKMDWLRTDPNDTPTMHAECAELTR